jgi:hypothetical protein
MTSTKSKPTAQTLAARIAEINTRRAAINARLDVLAAAAARQEDLLASSPLAFTDAPEPEGVCRYCGNGNVVCICD